MYRHITEDFTLPSYCWKTSNLTLVNVSTAKTSQYTIVNFNRMYLQQLLDAMCNPYKVFLEYAAYSVVSASIIVLFLIFKLLKMLFLS
jgi:hypothetical protein